MEATMRKFAIFCIGLGITVLVSSTIIAAGHRTSQVATLSIDTTAITRAAGTLPVVEVREPF
jgi:hypothetical protein